MRGFRISRGAAALLAQFLLICFISAPAYAGRDDVAVVIGNQDYSKSNTHNVEFAVNDARAIKAFLIDRLGYDESNILYEENATLGTFKQLFGTPGQPDGKLWNWVRKGRSNVFVYYSGHGAMDVNTKEPYLIPADIDPTLAASGYPAAGLDQKLKELKTYLGDSVNVILVLDACFSGKTGGGNLGSYSAGLVPNWSAPSPGIIRLSAAGPNEVANWDKTRQHGLFTAKLLEAVEGAADKKPFGDENSRASWTEIAAYVSDEVDYASRRQHGRQQTPEIPKDGGPPWNFEAGETPRGRELRLCREEPARWKELLDGGDVAAIQQAAGSFQCPEVKALVAKWAKDSEADIARQREITRQQEQLARELAAQREAATREADAHRKAAAEAEERKLAEIARAKDELEAARQALARERLALQTPPSEAPPAFESHGNSVASNVQPSFDCNEYYAKPRSHKDRNPHSDLLCSDAEAAGWDYQLGVAYRSYRDQLSSSERQELILQQRAWIKNRNAACPASWSDVNNASRRASIVSCVIAWTKSRINDFQ